MPAEPVTEQEEDEEDEEDDEDGAVAVEREVDFKFQDFVNRFAQPNVIQALGLALRHFDTNTVYVNHCILKLLHRIAWDSKMPAMLFQASIFRTFQRIYAEADRPQFKELVKFATYIIRQFIKVGETNKKIFMELLFWKNSREAFDAEKGYGSYETKSNAMKKAWTEEEENELRVLFMEHKEKEIQEDVSEWILNNLVDNTKTKRQVERKLKELMLIDKDYKKTSTSSRPAKDWEEMEIVQLTQLFNEFKDAMDPLSCITDRLDVKRPKARVKQKILELGLADNKALRKKRTTKSRGHQEEDELHSFRSNIDDDEILDSDSSSSDEENENRNTTRTTKVTPRAKAKNIAKKSKHSVTKKTVKIQKLELPAVKKLILEIIQKDMADSLKWVSECLTETAEDQEQDINLDGNEGIPLVPINAKDMQAIKNPVFEKFLLGIGIQKPASEQEKFWRIPGNMLAADLTKQANFIDELVEKGADAFPEYNEQPVVEQRAEESSDEDVFDRLRNFISKPNEEEPFVREEGNKNVNENNEDNSIIEYDLQNGVMDQDSKSSSAEKTKNRNTSTKKIAAVDSSDDSDSNNAQTNDLNVLKSNTKKKSKRISVLNDSDESDSEIVLKNNKTNKKKSKRIQLLNDSDESDNENVGENTEDNENTEPNEGNQSGTTKKSKRILDESDDSDSEKIEDKNAKNDKSKKTNKPKALVDDSEESDDNLTSSENTESVSKRTRESDSESNDYSIKRKKLAVIDSDED